MWGGCGGPEVGTESQVRGKTSLGLVGMWGILDTVGSQGCEGPRATAGRCFGTHPQAGASHVCRTGEHQDVGVRVDPHAVHALRAGGLRQAVGHQETAKAPAWPLLWTEAVWVCSSEGTPSPAKVPDTYSHVLLTLATTDTAKTSRTAVGSISTIVLPSRREAR